MRFLQIPLCKPDFLIYNGINTAGRLEHSTMRYTIDHRSSCECTSSRRKRKGLLCLDGDTASPRPFLYPSRARQCLTYRGAGNITNTERALRQAVSSVSKSYKQKPMKPSLARVAVSSFYDKLKHQLSQCQSYRKPVPAVVQRSRCGRRRSVLSPQALRVSSP